jgi:hypothetical protein
MPNARLHSALHRQGRENHEIDIADAPWNLLLAFATIVILALLSAEFFNFDDLTAAEVVAAHMREAT